MQILYYKKSTRNQLPVFFDHYFALYLQQVQR
jgi:hypothetical protein